VKKYCKDSSRRGTSFIHGREGITGIGHILRRNCLLKHVTEGKIKGRREVTGKRGQRDKQLQDDLKGSQRILETESGSSRMQTVENSP
jgi:hypothetical protein